MDAVSKEVASIPRLDCVQMSLSAHFFLVEPPDEERVKSLKLKTSIMEFATPLYLSGLAASSLMLALMTATVASKGFRFWPPGERNARWIAYWTLATLSSISILYLTVTGPELKTPSDLMGSLIAVAGLGLTLKAIKDLELERTYGLEKNFVEKGLYRYSRNPQVLGNLLTLLGVTVVRPIFQILSLSLLTGLWLIMMVFAEERWLKEKYGEKFVEYRGRVPRFLF
jgi:protein-S-isoprenylcysteine O-methyltransferase Ste14